MNRSFMLTGSVAGAIAVGFGAFGAHVLKDQISPEMLDVFQTGIQYLFVHALVLLLVGSAGKTLSQRILRLSGIAFVTGMVLFSGSLVLLSITGLKWLGAVAPIGGTAFIAGWVLLAAAVWKKDR